MKDINSFRITGNIFWSKLEDKQTYSTLRLGVKVHNSLSLFCAISNPNVKIYDYIKSGNKVILSGWMDLWEKQDGSSEITLKTNANGMNVYPKEKVLPEVNSVTILGKILNINGNIATIEMCGDRNPKTNEPTIRKTKVRITDDLSDVIGKQILLEATFINEDNNGKNGLVIEAIYNKIIVL